MPKPYLERHDGDLISASDWNEVQVRAREEIAAVDAKITGIDPSSDVTVRNLTVTGAARVGIRVQEARLAEGDKVWSHIYSYDGAQKLDEKATRVRPGMIAIPGFPYYAYSGSGYNSTNDTPTLYCGGTEYDTSSSTANTYTFALRVMNAPRLELKLERDALVLLTTSLSLCPMASNVNTGDLTRNPSQVAQNTNYYNDLFQLVIGEGESLVPVRSSGLLGEVRPTAKTFSTWAAAHAAYRKSKKVLPSAVRLSYTPTGYIAPFQFEEQLEMPKGTWTIRLATFAHATLYDVAIRALILPLGDAP